MGIIFILGPTASGKSSTAVCLARELNGEVVSCDSMLVYKEPCILTAKPGRDLLGEVRHHCIDVVSVTEQYDVHQYFSLALGIIKDLVSRKVPVIVCGGTGLYAAVLLDGIFEGAGLDEGVRSRLYKEAETKGNAFLYSKLKDIDPRAAGKISPNDLKRVTRALEVYEVSGKTITEKKTERQGLWKEFNVRLFGLDLPRDRLYYRINTRVDKMMAMGAVDEALALKKMDLSLTAGKIIGIEELSSASEGKISLDEAVLKMKQNTRRFAKRQGTWFRKESRIEWIQAADKTPEQIAGEIREKVIKNS